MRRKFYIGQSISGWTAIEAYKAYQLMSPNPETDIVVFEVKEGEAIFNEEEIKNLREQNDRLIAALENISIGERSVIGEDRFGIEIEADYEMTRDELIEIADKALEKEGL